MNLKNHIRSVPDFPKNGILFYDIGTLLADGTAWKETQDRLAALIAPQKPDYLLAIESRGFLVAAPLAAQLGLGLVMVRKKGKLPGETAAHNYALEYGEDTLEIQKGIIPEGKTAFLIDDLLATGGTANAAITLAQQIDLTVKKALFIIELTFLSGRDALPVPVESLLSYDS